MGLFGSIGDAIWGSAARRAKGRYVREEASQRIRDIEAQRLWRGFEDPREQAHQKQKMYSRGIGNSSMARQEKARLDLMQSQRNTRLSQQLDLANFYKKYVDRQARYEEISTYLGMADTVLSMAVGYAAGGPLGAITAGQMGAGSATQESPYLDPKEGYNFSGGGDYNYSGYG